MPGRDLGAGNERDPAAGSRTVGHKKGEIISPFLNIVAERTGLEPATPGVTGRYSNQLNYRSVTSRHLTTSHNFPGDAIRPLRPHAPPASQSEWQIRGDSRHIWLVGAEGFEPPTFAL